MKTNPHTRRDCENCKLLDIEPLKCKCCGNGLNFQPRDNRALIVYIGIAILVCFLVIVASVIASGQTVVRFKGPYKDGDYFSRVTATDPDHNDSVYYKIRKGNSGNAFIFGVIDPAGSAGQKDYTGKLYINNSKALCQYAIFDMTFRVTDTKGLWREARMHIDMCDYCRAFPFVRLKAGERVVRVYVKDGTAISIIHNDLKNKYIYKPHDYRKWRYTIPSGNTEIETARTRGVF